MSIFDSIGASLAADFVTGPTITPHHQQPRREWVGLTNKEVQTCWDDAQNAIAPQYAIYHAIESKLRERNT
jgi:hypothetical protein